MGAITLSNTVTNDKHESLDGLFKGIVNISGVFKAHCGHCSTRSKRLWQPFCVSGCKQYVAGFKQKVINRYRKIL